MLEDVIRPVHESIELANWPPRIRDIDGNVFRCDDRRVRDEKNRIGIRQQMQSSVMSKHI